MEKKKINPRDVKLLIEVLKKRNEKKKQKPEKIEITDHNFDEIKLALGKSKLVKVIEQELAKAESVTLEQLALTEDTRRKPVEEKRYKKEEYHKGEKLYSERNVSYEEQRKPIDYEEKKEEEIRRS